MSPPAGTLNRLSRRFSRLHLDGETPLAEAVADSIDAVDLLCAIHEEFGIRLSEEEMSSCRCVADLAEVIERRIHPVKS